MDLTSTAILFGSSARLVQLNAFRRQELRTRQVIRRPFKVCSYKGKRQPDLDEDSGVLSRNDLSGQPLGPTETNRDVYGMRQAYSDEADAVPFERLTAQDLSGQPLGITDSKWEMPGNGPLNSDSPFCFGRSLDIQKPVKLVHIEQLHGESALSDEADMIMYDRLTDADLVGQPLGPSDSKWEVHGKAAESDQEEVPGFGLTESDLVNRNH